jgi:hypothetical protein
MYDQLGQSAHFGCLLFFETVHPVLIIETNAHKMRAL